MVNELGEEFKKVFFNKYTQIILTLILFSIILFTSTYLRLGNIESLKDITTGKYLPSDPDACYELRVAQTLLETGDISGIDNMRNQGLNLGYTQEMLPKILVVTYKLLHSFGSNITLDYLDVIYPVFAFAFGLIIFFCLCLYLTKSKSAGLIASALLAYSPIYLTRNTAGVSSHEALGMPFMFLSMLIFVIALTKFSKSWKNTILYSTLVGISYALSFFSWTGASNFVLMIISIGAVIFYLFGIDDKDISAKLKFAVFNIIFIISSIVSVYALTYSPMIAFYSKFISNYGIISLFIAALSIIDCLILKFENIISAKTNKYNPKYRIVYSIITTIICGVAGLIIIGKNPISLFLSIYTQLIYPMSLERVALTVAYYQQPYISDLIAQYSKPIFTLFVIGMVLIGYEISKSISTKNHRFWFVSSWTFAIIGMMFSRTSPTSVFNGTNFISQVVYVASLVTFIAYFAWLYFKDKFNMTPVNVFLFSWMFIMLLSTRSAVRVIFVIYCFVAFTIAYTIIKFKDYAKNSKDVMKYLLYTVLVLSLLIAGFSIFGNPITKENGNWYISNYSAGHMGPIADEQWQYAMSWVRNNTEQRDIFAHWWDYGYQIQTIGERPTVLDGGNSNAYWNHMFARYVLTTPEPKTALSFMKTHNVSYLLIDPTDMGKYTAYSKIGGDLKQDRYSSVPVMVSNPAQTFETSNGTILTYSGTTFVDEDIVYNNTLIPGTSYDKNELPKYNAYLIGVRMKYSEDNGTYRFEQPTAIYYYNNLQIPIPIRYVYFNGQIIDFGNGINSVFRIVPRVSQSVLGLGIDYLGTGIYLSERVQVGLYSRLYLMNDISNQYNGSIKLAHMEENVIVRNLKNQGFYLGEFLYLDGYGLLSPIKIWEINYPDSIIAKPGYMATSGEYGSADGLV